MFRVVSGFGSDGDTAWIRGSHERRYSPRLPRNHCKVLLWSRVRNPFYW